MSNPPSLVPRSIVLVFATIAPCYAGLVVTQTDKGYQFSEAVSLSINGKDKVLSVGANPKSVSAGKFPSVKLDDALFRDRATSYFALSSEGSVTYVIPEGLPKGTQPDLVQSWKAAKITSKSQDKIQAEIPAASFVAFLPGDLPALVIVARNASDIRLIDSSDNSFTTQLSLIAAIAKAYPKNPAAAPLQRYVEDAMRVRYESFRNGTTNTDILDQALRFSDLSQAVYPGVPEQAKLRDEIGHLKLWLDRKVAVLRALAAGGSWDHFVIGDSDFDQYEKSFPDLGRLRTEALKLSLDQHRKVGEELFGEHEFGGALRQFRLASMRQPSDKLLHQRVVASWASYSREVAMDHQRERKQLAVGEREVVNQSIQFATNYKNENKLDFALKSILEAEAVDPASLSMLLKKAEILGAQSEFAKALDVLDQYDLHAVDEEREKASSLRNQLLFKQKSTTEDMKEQLQKALADGQFVILHDLAERALQTSNNDPDLLYQAATAAIISRETERSRALFLRYLSITNTLDANPEQRAKVRSLLASSSIASAEGSGSRNWLSGKKLPSNVFYCPISLAFQPKIEHIEASGKMKVSYEWNGDQLVSITPTFEKVDKNTGEPRINFFYSAKFPQVISATEGGAPPPVFDSKEPDQLLKHASLVVLNNPYIDPDSVEKLTGRNVSLAISGNRFFQPFVWDKIHYFRLTYDPSGRVARAVELSDSNGPPTGVTLDFDWEGSHLTAIHGYQGTDLRHRSRIYDRTMEYRDGQLVAEAISGSGKGSRIKYIYNGDRLASAQLTSDSTLDDRSRQVTFR